MTAPEPLAQDFQAKDLLVVDDNSVNLGVLSSLLRDAGYRVRVATNGRRAMEAIRNAPPHLVMLDISMPGMDGFQVCELIKGDPGTRHIPVIFISAHDEAMDKVRAFAVGGADYVQKPYQVEEVLARVKHHLQITNLQTSLLERNRALEQVNLSLQEVERLKASFTSMLVHDLRNPLSAMSLILEGLSQEGQDQDLVERCQGQLAKAITFLNELLDISRGEAQGMQLQVAPLDPRALLESVQESLRPIALHRLVHLTDAIPWELPGLCGDSVKLERALANLLGNALKFTPPGGTVTLGAEPARGEGVEAGRTWLRIWIRDTGRGIPAAQLPYVFDPYRQAYSHDASLGSGLGLAIVARIVSAHGGRISVQSEEGVGTEFTMLLPVERVEIPALS